MNKLGMLAREIDELFDRAIKEIGNGESIFSCLALPWNSKVKEFYREVMEEGLPPVPGDYDSDRLLYGVMCFAEGKPKWFNFEMTAKLSPEGEVEAKKLRIVMLSLMRAAWRDLI